MFYYISTSFLISSKKKRIIKIVRKKKNQQRFFWKSVDFLQLLHKHAHYVQLLEKSKSIHRERKPHVNIIPLRRGMYISVSEELIKNRGSDKQKMAQVASLDLRIHGGPLFPPISIRADELIWFSNNLATDERPENGGSCASWGPEARF